jgi:hypothetical protein
MTSPLLCAPQVTYSRVVNKLYVNKAPYAGDSANPSSLRAWKTNPLTKNAGPKHKAKQPYHRRIR